MNLVLVVSLFMCMRWIFLLFVLFFTVSARAQDGYIFTKTQHEQIKKNLQDYKVLIKDYRVLDYRFDSLKSAFQFLKKLHSGQTFELEELQVKYQNLKRENSDLVFYTIENDKLKKLNESLQRELDYKNKSLFDYKRKYEREHRLTRGDRIIGNSILGTFIVCGMWAIYTSLETNYFHK